MVRSLESRSLDPEDMCKEAVPADEVQAELGSLESRTLDPEDMCKEAVPADEVQAELGSLESRTLDPEDKEECQLMKSKRSLRSLA
jgi:hypothetical protein